MNTKPQLTILTLPIPNGPDALQQNLWLAARQLKYWCQGKRSPKYSGHYAVTRSVVEGMSKAGLQVNHNPRRLSHVASRVHVLSSIKALRQMIGWKRQGLINQLTCGPNIVVRSQDFNSILASPEIDAVVNHTDWGCDFWAADHPELRDRCLCWGAGVDTDFWEPPSAAARNTILVFDKRRVSENPDRVKPYIRYLESLGYEVEHLVRCGSSGYTLAQYRSLLHCAQLMVGFTVGSESQGIAWTEAWAADVPTLIMQQTENEYNGLRYRCNTAPFLTLATGYFFEDFKDFKQKFQGWEQGQMVFHPRKWVLQHMSDEITAMNLYNKLQQLSYK